MGGGQRGRQLAGMAGGVLECCVQSSHDRISIDDLLVQPPHPLGHRQLLPAVGELARGAVGLDEDLPWGGGGELRQSRLAFPGPPARIVHGRAGAITLSDVAGVEVTT